MTKLDFRARLKNKLINFRMRLKKMKDLKVKGLEGLFLFLMLIIACLSAGSLFTEYVSDNLVLALIFVFTVFLNLVLVMWLYDQKRRFLIVYAKIPSLAVNFLLLSALFILKLKLGAGSDPYLGFIAGFWAAFSFSFTFIAAVVWLGYFNNKDKIFQTVWTPRITMRTLKPNILAFLSIGVFFACTHYLAPHFGLEPARVALVESYLTWVSYPIIALAMASIVVVLVINITPLMTAKYCKMCIELIKNRFSKVRKTLAPNDEYIEIFPSIINRVNHLLKFYYVEGISPMIFNASQPPHILNRDLYYKKLLMVDIIQNKKRMNKQDEKRSRAVKRGLNKLSKSLENKGDKFFCSFVEGLAEIANSGEKKPADIEGTFELKPLSRIMWIKEYQEIIGLVVVIASTVLSILLKIIFGL